MGLDIGVVKIEYLERPGQPMYRFMQDLQINRMAGLDEYYDDIDSRDAAGDMDDGESDEIWNDGRFCEFSRNGLMKRACGWAILKNLTPSERSQLLDWVARLPWQNDFLMLHLGD